MYETIIEALKGKLGENLLCAVRFGSEGQPNNFLCILEKMDFLVLEQLKETLKKEKIAPLFFTKNELQNAADVFPLEFLDIKHPHTVLYGEDLVATIKIEKMHVRRELESELRSKLIHLRENYIGIKEKDLKKLLANATPSLMPLFYGLLYLENLAPPTDLNKLFDVVAEKYSFDVDILRTLKQLRDEKIKNPDLKKYVEELLNFLQKAIGVIDKKGV